MSHDCKVGIEESMPVEVCEECNTGERPGLRLVPYGGKLWHTACLKLVQEQAEEVHRTARRPLSQDERNRLAYADGWEAWENERRRECNPYPRNDPRHHRWLCGWLDSRAHDE